MLKRNFHPQRPNGSLMMKWNSSKFGQKWNQKLHTWFHFLASVYQSTTLQEQSQKMNSDFKFFKREWQDFDLKRTCLEFVGLLDRTWTRLLLHLCRLMEVDLVNCYHLHRTTRIRNFLIQKSRNVGEFDFTFNVPDTEWNQSILDT